MTTYRTSTLGWDNANVPGSDIGVSLAALCAALVPNDIVIFDELYRFSGDFTIPDNVTFVGEGGGSEARHGLLMLDGFPNSEALYGVPYNKNKFVLTVGDGCLIEKFLMTHEHQHFDGELIPGGNGRTGWIWVRGKKNFKAVGSRIDTQATRGIVIEEAKVNGEVDAATGRVEECTLIDQKYALHIRGDARAIDVRKMHFEGGYSAPSLNGLISQNFGDAIKTANAENRGPTTLSITGCLFEKMIRDGVDTTGGLLGGRIVDNTFRKCGIDLKNSLGSIDALGPTVKNENAVISLNSFEDGGIVFTTNWNITEQPLDENYLVRNIKVDGNILFGTGGDAVAFFFKDCDGISMDGNIVEGMTLLKTASEHDIVRNIHAQNTVYRSNGSSATISNVQDSSFHFALAEINDDEINQLLGVAASSKNVSITGTFRDKSNTGGSMIYLQDCREINIDIDAKGTGAKRLARIVGASGAEVDQVDIRGKVKGFTCVASLGGQSDNVHIHDDTLIEDVDQTVYTDADWTGTGLSYPGMP